MTVLSEPSTTHNGSPGALDLLGPAFEQRLIEGIRPISEHFLALALHHLFDTGLYDHLAETSVTIGTLAGLFDMEEDRLRGFLLYLANEGIVQVRRDEVSLTAHGRRYGEFRPWYTMLIGGYTSTLQQMGGALRKGSPYCTRDGRYVGMGSCEISRYDGMPMTRELLADAGVTAREVLDLGCGNALYLTEFCRDMPEVRAWGVEPDKGGYDAARQLVESTGMAGRVNLVNSSATDFLRDPPAACDPDLIVFGYVLHEILAQEGADAIVSLLRSVAHRFPQINIVVIEVANEIENPAVMRHGLATNFWNPYYLIHYFTHQRLEKRAYWDNLFTRAGLQVTSFVTTDSRVDSTGLELGYLLRGPEHR